MKEIGSYSFERCYSLPEITIPATIETIGDSPFSECSSLETIIINGENDKYETFDGILFTKGQYILIQYPGGKKGDTYSFGESTTTINRHAFVGNHYLTSITIPTRVTTIKGNPFANVTTLDMISVQSTIQHSQQMMESCLTNYQQH